MRTSKNGTVLKLISSAQITLSKIYDAYTINLSNSNFDIVCNDQGDALAGEIGANGRAITTTSVVMGTKKLTAVASNPTAEQYCISISEQVGCTAAKNGNDKIYINTLSNSIAGKFSISFNIEGTTTVVKDVVFVKKINDAPNFIDGQFSFGTGYWSATPDGTGVLGANVTIKKSNEATYGTNLLEIANDTWVYSKKYIDIEKDRIYRCRFRAKQSIDNTIGNKIAYFGYTPYNSSGTAIGTDGSNNMYFASGTLKINTWTEWEYYVSTKARAEISTTVNGVKKIITPAIQAFPTGAVKFKPMFIVNFHQGNGIALVDGWILEDVTEKIEVSQLEYKASQIETTVNGIDANVISIKTYTDMSSNPMTLAAKANYSAYDTPNQGEVYLHGLNDKRNPADIDGKCIWNTKTVSLPKVMFNPNSIVPDGVPVYMVRNIADNKWWSVWKETNDSIITWKRALADVNISSTIYTHTWNEANDIVVGYYVIKKTNPRNREASIVIAQLFDGALNYKQATSMTLVGSISQLEILESEVNLKVANTDNKISQLKLEADKITQRVQSTENTITNHTTQLGQVDNKIHNAINSLQIGGKNYVLKSDYYITDHDYANFDFSILQELRGKTVTVSVEVDLVNAQGTRVGFEPSIRYADGTIQYFGVWQYINSPTTMKKRISFTHTILDKEIISYDQRGIYIQGVVSGTARIGRPKLEIGNQATDWTPAPEDIDSSIRDVDTKVESTKNKIAELELTTDSITQKVQSTENNVFTVTNKFDNLQIGGRNLFKGHNDKELTLNNYGDTGSFTQFRGYFTFDPAEYVNKEFTISFYAKSPNGSTALQLYNSNDNPRYFYFWKQLDNNLNNEWKYYTYTFTNIDRGVDFHIDNKIEIYAPQQMGVMVKQIKIEEGNKATSWTPAPEDTNDAISNVDSKLESTRNKVAEIVTSLDGINLKVQSTEQIVNNHATQLGQVDNKITNTNNKIDNLAIGGRNLLLDSGIAVTNNDYCIRTYMPSELLIAGETYTVTICVTPANNVEYFMPYMSSGYAAQCALSVNGTKKQVVSGVFKASYYPDRVPTKPSDGHARISVYRLPNDGTVVTDSTIHWIKIEKGNKATDWTPAPEDINNAITSVDTKIEMTTNKLSELKLETDSITQRVQSTENKVTTVTNNFNNLQVGGRNLIYKDIFEQGHWWVSGGNTSAAFLRTKDGIDFLPNVDYTISVNTLQINHAALSVVCIVYENGVAYQDKCLAFTSNTTQTFKFDKPWRIYIQDYSGSHVLHDYKDQIVKMFKLEKGNKATDWTPAPEDIDSSIHNVDTKAESTKNKVAEIITSLDGINLKVQNTENTISSHTAQLGQVDGKINDAKNQAILDSRYIPDTRNANEAPRWYISNYPRQTITEFKRAVAIGLSTDCFGTLETKVPWTDESGGFPVQTFRSSTTPTYERRSLNSDTWGSWYQVEDVLGSQNKANTAQNNANAYTNGQIAVVNQTISDRVAEIKLTTDSITSKVSKTEQLAMIAQYSKMLYTDPTFKDGYNGVNIYNNNGNGTVSVSRIAKSDDCPTTSGYMLEITTNGPASPYCGGFFFANLSRPNAIFVTRIIAKLPIGSELTWQTNPIGDGGNAEWLTGPYGTGTWTEYILKVNCGASGQFSSTNYFALVSNNNPVTWYVAFATVFDVTETSNIESRISSAEQKITDSAIINTVTNTINNTVNSAVNELQVGGRNYCAKTNIASLYSIDSLFPVELDRNNIDCPNGFFVTGHASELGGVRLPHVINKNGYWTISFDVRGTQNTVVGLHVDICNLGSTKILTTHDNTWKRVSVTVNVTNYSSNVYHFIDFAKIAWAHFQIKNIKVEEGNKATDYTPALEDIDNAINNVDAKVENTNSKVAELKITADSITQKVESSETKIATVTNNLNNLQVGGRNLLVNSSFTKNADQWYSQASFVIEDDKPCAKLTGAFNSTVTVRLSILDKVIPNQQYTVSGWVKVKNITFGSINPVIMYYVDGEYNNNGNVTWYGYGAKNFDKTATEWQYVTWTFTTDDKLKTASSCYFFVYCRDFTGDVFFYNLKLEKGNKSTDWTAAPEDIDSTISNIDTKVETTTNKLAELKLTTDSITQRVQSTENTIASHTTQLGQVDNKINNAVNEIQIGARNLILKSKHLNDISESWMNHSLITAIKYEDYMHFVLNTSEMNTYVYFWNSGHNRLAQDLVKGKIYTMSFDVRTNCSQFRIGLRKEPAHQAFYDYRPSKRLNEWDRYDFTFTWNEQDWSDILWLVGVYEGGTDKYIDVKNWQIEEGNKATNWTPAPEDISNDIASVDSKVETTKNKVAEIATSLDGISLKVQSTEQTVTNHTTQLGQVDNKINNAVGNLQIGGRNLLINSNKTVGENSSIEFQQFADIAPIFDKYGLIEYTISFDIKSKDTSNNNTVEVYGQNGSDSRHSFHAGVTVTTEWQRKHVTITPVLSDESISATMLAFYGVYNTGNIPVIRNVKIEKGNKATDWTPAPEDIDNSISNINNNKEDKNSRYIFARGTGLGYNAPSYVEVEGRCLTNGQGRGLRLNILNPKTLELLGVEDYDTYADWNAINALNARLYELNNGDYIIIVTSYDAAYPNRCKDALRSIGGNLLPDTDDTYREAYALIGRSKFGQGNGVEMYIPKTATDQRYAEVSVKVGPNGEFIGVNGSNMGGEINKANIAITATKNQVASIETNLSGITQRVQSTESNITTITGDIAQLQFGGRNYVITNKLGYYDPYNVVTEKKIGYIKSTCNPNNDNSFFTLNILDFTPKKAVYTLSGMIKVNGAIPTAKYFTGYASTYNGEIPFTNEYDPATGKFVITQTYDGVNPWILHATTSKAAYANDVVELMNLKFEEGNKATPWTPAPEDIVTVDQKIENTTNKVAEIKTTVDGIDLKVQHTERTLTETTNTANSANSKIDNLTIGGRNLFKGYNDDEIILNNYNNVGSFTQFYNFAFNPAEYINKEFTISFYAKSPNGQTELHCYNLNGDPRYFNFYKTLDGNLSTEWKYYSFTITNTDNGASKTEYNKIEIYAPQQMGVRVKKIKIEEGNKATSWTPAPEDVDNAISQLDTKVETTKNKVAEIATSLDGINLKVQSTEQTITNHTTQLNQVDNKIDNAKNQAIHDSRIIPDTRGTNETPEWYMKHYGCQTITEFKLGSIIQLAGVGFGAVETKVPWGDPSGGYPIQTFRSSATPTYERRGATLTEWSDWIQVEDVLGSQNKANTAQNNANAYTNGQIAVVNQTISDRVAEIKLTTDSITSKVSKTEQLAMIAQHSKMLYTDPTFKDGYNGVNIYNNNGNGTVSVSRIAKSDDCPTTSGYMLEITTNGAASPYSGGFFFANQVRPNAIFVTRIIAKLPIGSELTWQTNPIGDGGNAEWLTGPYGTGTWTEYVLKVTCGTTGNFHNTNFFALICPSNPVTWHVAFATVFDVTETSNIESRISSAEQKITDSAIINTVTSTINNTVNSAVNNLSIGGRNYCTKTALSQAESIDPNYPIELNKNNADCPNGFSVVGHINVRGAIRLPFVINKNGYWTVSFDVRGIQNTPVGFWVDVCDLNSTHILTTGDNTWKRVSVTTNVTNYSSNVYHFVDFADFAWAHFQIRNIKIEEGNKATDYTPAPEDIDSAINDVNNKVTTATKELAELKITSNSITQRVESSEQLINNKEDKNSRYIFARGTGCDYLAPSYVEIQGACVTNGQGRGLRIHALNPETLSCFFIQDYDTFESDNAVNLFNAKINELNAGNHIIIVTSYDAAYPWKCKDALRSIGGSLLPDTHDTYREAYALIGKSKLGQGNGVEMYIPKTATDQRYAEVSVKIGPKGEFAGVNHSNSVSQIEILKNNIDLKVQKNNVISSINLYTQDDENGGHSGVKIRGDKIDLQGQVTFSSLADSNVAGSIKNIFAQQDNQTVINGGMIKTHTIKGNDLLLKGNMSVTDNSGNKTFEITDSGEVNIQARSLRIGSSNVATNNDISNAVNNLQVGGVNLLWNSSFTKNADQWYSQAAFVVEDNKPCAKLTGSFNGTAMVQQSILGKLVPNQQYTVSGWIKLKNIAMGNTNPVLMYYIDGGYYHNGSSTWFGYGSYEFDRSTTEWQYVTWTFTTDDKLKTASSCYFFVYCRDYIGDVFFYNLKLEKGNKSTDWTAASEDKVDNNQEAIFNKLFANGQQGFTLENGRVYINGEVIKANTISGNVIKANTLSGEVIKAGTLNASKIKAGVIQATSGGSYFDLDDGSMLLGSKSSSNYLEWTGYTLNIKANSLTIGAKSVATSSDISSLQSKISSTEQKITPTAILNAVNEQIGKGGAISTTSTKLEKGKFTIYNGALVVQNNKAKDVMWCNTEGWLTASNLFINGNENPSNLEIGGSNGNKGVGIRTNGSSYSAYLDFGVLDRNASFAENVRTGKYHRFITEASDRTMLNLVTPHFNIRPFDGYSPTELTVQGYIEAFHDISTRHNINAVGTITAGGFKRSGTGFTLIATDTIDTIKYAKNNKSYLEVRTPKFGAWGIDIWASDEKIKENIVQINLKQKTKVDESNQKIGLDLINNINHYSYNYIEEYGGEYISCGYVAQELQELNSNIVLEVEQDDGSIILQPSAPSIIPNITLALKQQQDEINELKKIIKLLENKLDI